MDSAARESIQKKFKELPIGKKFQMVNSVMKAAIPGSQIFEKINSTQAESNKIVYTIRPDWHIEELR